MPEERPEKERSPWRTAHIFPAFILLTCAGISASFYGGGAKSLGIPGAGLAQNAHWLMIGIIIVIPLALSSGQMARWRDVITACAAFLCIAFPAWLLELGSVRIPLTRSMSYEETMAMRDTLKIPTLPTKDGKEGPCLRLRRSDYSEAVRTYIASIGVASPEALPLVK